MASTESTPVREATLLRQIHLAIGRRRDCMIWRNSKGTRQTDRAFVRMGLLADGSADLIGIGPGGRFLAIEVKRPNGRRNPDQVRFIDLVIGYGGIGGFAESVEDAIRIIDNAKELVG